MTRMLSLSRRLAPASRAAHTRALHALSSQEIRARFLGFFEAQGHAVVPSASLVPPGGDTSLLFTNAGMVPFKQLFLGNEQRAYQRATSAQRCVRAGGKHNDLDQVGLTRRHHTQFEMLGNFSFGDYFKEEAIVYAWRFLTQELALPVERMHVTVLHNDDEARALWRKVAGLADDKIWSCQEDDNFWAMGDSGPCGPCSEIFWDLGDHIADPDERFLELWNLVFMQFSRVDGDASGTLHPLPKRSVDTGMGLERVASVLQGVPSNYHTDLFVPILQDVARVLDARRTSSTSTSTQGSRRFEDVLAEELDATAPVFGASDEIRTMRIVADHLRAAYAMLADGIFPSNVGRGYVLRRILRRAIRHAQHHGVSQSFLSEITVPEWASAPGHAQMRAIVANEEKAFAEMLLNGKKAMDRAFGSAATHAQREISGADAFRLYDTYGIPLDITQVLAEEKGFRVDVAGFDVAMEEHRRKASDSSAFSSANVTAASASGSARAGGSGEREGLSVGSGPSQVNSFVGYDTLRVENARVLSAWIDATPRNQEKTKTKTTQQSTCWLTLDPCPFYAEGGGQIGDRGHVDVVLHENDGEASQLRLEVLDTKRVAGDAIAVQCAVPADVSAEDAIARVRRASHVVATVDEQFRAGCATHHSATHLLQAALKRVLGDHVTQCGSLVASDRLRFDFAHFGALSLEELAQVEALVNEMALQRLAVETRELPRDEAEASGAICNFGEKYGDVVRVVRIGDDDRASVSSEFCGGTHVANASAVFPFVILSEGSVAAGTRRMEAVAGVEGAKHLQSKDQTLQRLAATLETTPAKVPERVAKMQKHVKALESQLQSLSDALATLPHTTPLAVSRDDRVELHALPTSANAGSAVDWSKLLRRRAEWLRTQRPERAHVVVGGRQLACIADVNGATHAGQWLKQTLLQPLDGRGGGNAAFAQGSIPEHVTTEQLMEHLSREQ
ncbi:hypothetical protein PINS_up000985 [Pythium insidiosum]|nr:hypothetical protein PINS_up000985 [Pythium insidiosum]